MRPLRTTFLLSALVCAACSNTTIERERPNRPPETRITSGPPDSSDAVSYRIDLAWSGTDPDGSIHHYDFLVADHPAAWDSISDISFTVPVPEDPRWRSTTAAETTLVVSADTLRLDPQSLPPDQVLEHFFERWHTVFVRAVDDHGLADRSPDYRTFNARTLAPIVAMKPPVSPGNVLEAPTTVTLSWTGEDPLDKTMVETPLASRWAVVPTRRDDWGRYEGFPDSLYSLPDSCWTSWRDWNAADGSGTSALLKNLQLQPGEWPTSYLFAVQARDAAGAVTPVFDWQTPGKNNVAVLLIGRTLTAPVVTIRERWLGSFVFSGSFRTLSLDWGANQPVHFTWRGDASSYGSQVEAYRYGWDLLNPDQDAEWACGWSASCLEEIGPPRRFSGGLHFFYLQARDTVGQLTSLRLEFRILPLTMNRDLLFVDDTQQPQGQAAEVQEDARWRLALDSLRARAQRMGQPFDFDPSGDWYDVKNERQGLLPPQSTLFDYKCVTWSVVEAGSGSAISTLANFVDPFVERNLNAFPYFNYLTVYVDNGGKFWLSGDPPAYTIFKVMNRAPEGLSQLLPVNITNWDDRLQPHPEEDSVGVQSLLYRLGVEAVDIGSGGRAIEYRETVQQGCAGLRRALPPLVASQRFETEVELGHSHALVLPSSVLVEEEPSTGHDLTTEMAAGHAHSMHLSPGDIGALRAGRVVTLPTSGPDSGPDHRHTCRLRDDSGPGGAPVWLEPDPANWPQPPVEVNPGRLRANLEIYNMPSFLAAQSPPLAPPTWRVLVLYTFGSGVPEDPARGFVYPLTADGQPVVLLTKRAPEDLRYSRAICGFEPWRLRLESHVRLAETILLHHFGLGAPRASLRPGR